MTEAGGEVKIKSLSAISSVASPKRIGFFQTRRDDGGASRWTPLKIGEAQFR